MESPKLYRNSRCRHRTYHCVAVNYPVSWGVVQGPEWKYAKLQPYQSPWYRVCTKAMVISKGSFGHGEFKNVLSQSVQIPYLSLHGRKVPRFMEGGIGHRMEICETSDLPIPMVPRLYQSNGYIKRKLRAWRVQNCIDLVGADTVLTTAWKQTTPSDGVQYRALNGYMRKLGPTNLHGTGLAPKQWLYQKEATGMESSKMYLPNRFRYRTYHWLAANYLVSLGVVQDTEWKYAKLRPYQSPWYRVYPQSNGYIKRKLREWKVQKCIFLIDTDTILITAWPQITSFHGGQYRTPNGNMRNFGLTNSHGTAFPPKLWLYQKEATGMESPKMYCPSRCGYRTYQCMAAKYLISWGVV